MKKLIRQQLKKLGPVALVAAAVLVVLLLMRMQPRVGGGRSKQPDAVNSRADATRELVDMRADALLPLLQRIQQKNSGVFTLNAADTAGKGKVLQLQLADEAAARTVLFGDRTLTAEQQDLLKRNGIGITAAAVALPLKRQNGILVVTVPAVMAFAMAGH